MSATPDRDTGGVVFQTELRTTDQLHPNCTMYDLIDGTVDPGCSPARTMSGRSWGRRTRRASRPSRAGGAVTVDTCPKRYTNLNGRLPAQITASRQAGLPAEPDVAECGCGRAIAGQIQQAYVKNSIAPPRRPRRT